MPEPTDKNPAATPDRYRHKPTEVEAMRLTESNPAEVAAWCNGRRVKQSGSYHDYVVFDRPHLGTAGVYFGEYLVLDGEFRAWSAAEFEATYERSALTSAGQSKSMGPRPRLSGGTEVAE